MLNFKRIETKDISVIKEYFSKQDYRTCDFTIGGLYMWKEYFGYEMCEYKDTLFVRGKDVVNPNQISYAMPIGKLSTIDAIKVLINAEGKDEVSFCAIPESKIACFDLFSVKEQIDLPDWFDYLYDATGLATLVGHKYNKKRNKVNAFNAQYKDYYVEDISNVNIEKIKNFLKGFKKENADSDLAIYENNAVEAVLDSYETWGYEGIVLYVNNNVVAFTIGEIVKDTLYVHVEKADVNIEGSYQKIGQLFAKKMIEKGIKYINREEDVGDPGLRHSKMSYQPIDMLKKFKVVLYAK